MKRRLPVFYTSVLAATLFSPSMGWSEEETPVEQSVTGDSATQNSQVEEIVVTAQRRGENLQDVPIAITALTAATLERSGVKSTLDLSSVAPSVTMTTAVGGASLTIRGIGGTGSGSDDPANAIYIDGVYQTNAAALVVALNNIERVEVLSGPQGTLFGRNASGGVIQIITRDPSFTPHLDVEAGYGNYDTSEFSVYGTTGLTETLAMEVAVYDLDQRDGWGRDIVTGAEAYSGYTLGVRSKLKWTPTQDTTFTLIGSYGDEEQPSLAGVQIVPGFINDQGEGNIGYHDTNINTNPYSLDLQHGLALTSQQDFSWARLVDIASYDHNYNLQVLDSDGGPTPVAITPNSTTIDRSYSNELRVQSPDQSRISWIGGMFYLNNLRTIQALTTGTSFASVGGRSYTSSSDLTNSYALFGQTTIPIWAQNRVTVGLRYTIDDRAYNGLMQTGKQAEPTIYPELSPTNTKVTWRLALDHKFTDDIMGYISDSTGFKSGLYNGFSPSKPPAGPQTVDTYEIGVKSEFFNRRVRFNAAAFDNEFDDIQVKNTLAAGTLFLNAGKARIEGVDADVTAVPLENLTLNSGVTYLDGKYLEFKNAPFFRVNPKGGLIQFAGDASGKETVNTPKWVVVLGAQYTIPESIGDFALSLNWNYNGGFFWDPSNVEGQSPYQLLNAALSWTAPNKRWGMRLWGRNLLNQNYMAVANISTNGALYYAAAPLTFGASVSAHF